MKKNAMNMNPLNHNAPFKVWPKYSASCEGGEVFCDMWLWYQSQRYCTRFEEFRKESSSWRWRSAAALTKQGMSLSKGFQPISHFFDPVQILPLFFREQWMNVKVRSADERQPLVWENLHSGPQHTCHSSEWLSGLKGKQQDLHFELIIINILIWRRLRTSSCDTVASEEWSR